MAPVNGVLLSKCVPLGTNLNLSALPKLRPAPLSATAVLLKGGSSPSSSGYASSSNSVADEESMSMASNAAAPTKAKKRRLDHLSWEEKVQRKKLKNRVAAQTSRDRKKARMEEMEYEIKELTEKTEILQNKCESLQSINESLLAKNQKLDSEMEVLRQELAEMKQLAKNHSNSNTASVNANAEGCVSTLTGSAASNADSAAGYTSGHTVVSACLDLEEVATAAEAEQHNGLTLENCGALPSIQDMLLVDDEEFDARRLEELAESLLADITADLETGSGTCDEAAPKDAGQPERLPGPMVGTTAECLESDRHRADGLSNDTKTHPFIKCTPTPTKNNTDINNSPCMQVSQINGNPQTKATATTIPTTTTISAAAFLQSATPDTVYGTYDAKTNSITIVMDGDAVPVNEAVEEIYGEGVSAGEDSTDVIMKCPPPATSPSQVYLNVINATDDSDDEATSHLNFEPIEKFLSPRIKAISPLGKSPARSMHSITSDHGYESVMGSPASTTLSHLDNDIALPTEEDDFPWESNFDELFPSLI
ncbi:LOW QUALITY PROTEIN: uncharacterized protein LOC115771130 [Drosophila novamexicana]|uniref:LOW QUALITY PROTEIN: uncharacterized protein LOC115771130 n=1 Tax=Drosophila novamexicana TaxID=47314 RepID=UPI0011E58B26|nr:LOW QUALITY PROTEIN: uncharacterized protein LOC115771130 [Drosophila novamexicana]